MKKQLPFLFLMLFHVFVASASTIIAPPSATIAYNTPFCQSSNQELVTLIGTQGGTFSASPSSLSINPTTGTINPSTSVPGTYTVTYFIPSGVDPAFIVTTTVTINAQPEAGISGAVTVCESSATPIDLFSLITGEQSGGIWTRTSGTGGAFSPGAGTFTPAMGATTSTFTYTILGSNPCVNDSSVASVYITSQPDAGIDGAITVCNSNTATIDLYSIITGEQPGGVWSRTSGTGGTFNAIAGTFTPSPDATTNTFTYTIAGAAPCVNSSSVASVFIGNIQPQFSWETFTYCPNSVVPVLPIISDNGITGTWNPPVIDNQTLGLSIYTFTPDAGQCSYPILLTINIANSIQPVFTFSSYNFCIGEIPILPTTSDNGITGTWSPSTITSNSACIFTPNPGQCATTVTETFSVSPMPNATTTINSPICQGFTTVVTFAATPNSVIEYAIDGIANQSIVVNASGAATLSLPSLPFGNHVICLVSVTNGCTNTLNSCTQFTVLQNIDIAPIPSVSVCDQYTLPTLSQGNYYTEPNGTGTLLHAGDLITDTQAIYVYSENTCSSDEEYFVVNVFHPVVIAPIPDVTACGYYNLPINNDGRYYTEPHGAGTEISPGNIYTSQTIYLYATTSTSPSCVSEDAFTVTIIPAANPEIVSDNGTHYIYVDGNVIVQPLLLDSQLSGNYTYEWFNNFDVLAGATGATYVIDTYNPEQSWSIIVRATNLDTGCVTTSPVFWVYQAPVPAPIGDPNQTFTLGQTLADVVVIGSNIQWYDGLGRNVNANPLPLSTLLVNGATYYASQTINGHESSDRFMITIQLLANDTFHFKNLTYSPNPVENVLNVKSSDAFKVIKVYNNLGQEVYQQKCNTSDLKLELGFLKTGNYFIRLESDKKQQVIKVIKK